MFAILAACLLADPPQFVAVGPADEQAVGQLLALTPENAKLSGKFVTDVYSLRRTNAPLPAPPRGPALITTTGDRIAGRLIGGDSQSLRFQPTGRTIGWKVPLSSVAVVWLSKPPANTPFSIARYPWLPDNRRRDILLFRNGDTLRGTLDGFARDPVALRFAPEVGDARNIAPDEVAAIAFNPTLARTRKPKGPYYHLVLRDGTRLDTTTATVGTNHLSVKTLFGEEAEIDLADIVAIDIVNGKATYLADLKPKKVEQAGFLGTAWPWAANQSVRGEPLRLTTSLGEETFDRGLGTHPRTTLTYDLSGKYRRFEARIGLDPTSGARGRADVRVLVDGKEASPPELRQLAAGVAVPLRIDVKGAKELTLIVDFGPSGDVQADVNWADARVVE